MKILIDARSASSKSTGVGNYANSIIDYLLRIDKVNHYKIIASSDLNKIYGFGKSSNVEVLYIKSWMDKRLLRDLWYQTYIPHIIECEKIMICHGLNYGLPVHAKRGRTLYIATVHGLAPFLHRDIYRGTKYVYARYLIARSLYGADIIIAVSDHVKTELMNLFNVDSAKIRVIHVGISRRFKATPHAQDVLKVKERYGLQRNDYMLFVANDPISKNAMRLIRAYLLLREKHRNINLRLVIAGKKAYQCSSAIKSISGHVKDIKDDIVLIAPSYEDIPSLYNGAILYVHPSLYEGCPAPPLEAMACGTPVIASNTSSIPEVVGDAALLFDPYNVEEIAAAMYKALTDEQLRAELRQKGFERVKQFSWEKAARETLAVYEEVYRAK